MVTIGIYLLAAAVRACALSRAIMLTDSLLLVNLTSALLRPELPQVPFYRRLGGGGASRLPLFRQDYSLTKCRLVTSGLGAVFFDQ